MTGLLVVGSGFGCLTHTPAARDAGLDVVAVVGRDPDKTKHRAERFGIERWTTSLDEGLAMDGVDAVAVTTPPHAHAEVVLAAVAAGKHVVCEKPFSRDAAEARTMLDAAEAAGVVHVLGCEFRFDTGQALFKRTVQSGVLGDPTSVLFLLELPLIADHAAEVPAWWEKEGEGGGWLGAFGSHQVDQIRDALGEFESVSASLPVASGRPGMSADDTFTVHFRLRSGLSGILHSTAGSWGPIVADRRVNGTKGAVWLQGDDVYVGGPDGPRKVDVPDDLVLGEPIPPPADVLKTTYDFMHSMGTDRWPYRRLYERFDDLIHGRPVPDDPRPATFADGVAGMAVLDAIRTSAAKGGERTLVP